MKHPRLRLFWPLLLLAAWPLGAQTSPALSPAEALAKAQALWVKADQWTPGRSSGRFEELDDKGQVSSWTATVYQLGPQADKGLKRTLVSWIKDGKDETEQHRNDGPPPQNKAPAVPMDPKNRDRLTYKVRAENTLDGRPAHILDYSIADRDGDGSFGTLWLDPATGQPLRQTIAYLKNPMFIEQLAITSVYRPAGDRFEVTRLEFTAVGTFLMIKKTIRAVQDFSDYFYYPDRKRS